MEGTHPGTADLESNAAQAGTPPAAPSEDIPKSVPEAVFSSAPILDLSRRGLQHLGDVLKIPTLKQLHLQRNELCTIPRDFFQLLPNLTWLDLRYNRIQALPPGIGSHRCLKTLLLERNPIKMLPVQLGNVTTLRALNLRHCPLEFPPQIIVQKGPAAILRFLQGSASKLSARLDPGPQAKSLSQLPYPLLAFPGEGHTANPQGTRLKEMEGRFPPVEKLDLSDLQKSAECWEDWPNEEEIRRFWKLRQEIVEKEQVEVLQNQLLAMELPPNLRAVLRSRGEARPDPRPALRRKPPSINALPSLELAYPAGTGVEQLEERRASVFRELREKQEQIEQRRRDRRALLEWREQAHTMRKRKRELGKLRPPRRTLEAPKPPFATVLMGDEKKPATLLGRGGQAKEKSLQASNELRAFWEQGLERKLQQHIRQIQERRKMFQGLAPFNDVRKASEDLEVARTLLDGVMKLSKSHGGPALPGSHPLCLPALQHQNMFSNTKY
ncbi:leucine-rich repeat-containing protein 27 [Pipistrellus kuhlii]|uniref:Leucine rich repeat containing 27 n=1 Tax=Pipistrellus kuhlii TaxID=59472 RepID=A0A7J7VC07_PIPKU|nr:leucine-rich repeat-containing protein 27 [Pipistrellus kuhlii]KAF6322551.1 leucine rich repeat containing 27 [Pipistrellus kuhlii]